MENSSIEVVKQSSDFVNLSQNAEAAFAYAGALGKLATDKEHKIAIGTLAKIRDEKNRGDKIRRFFTDPLNEQVKAINAMFQPSIKKLEEAERMIRAALVSYQEKLDARAEEAKAKTMEKVESGKITLEQGVKKIENIKMPEKTVRTEEATVSYSVRLDVKVEDEAKIPREYLAPDMSKIKTVALALHKAKQPQIPGVAVVEVKTPVVKKSNGY